VSARRRCLPRGRTTRSKPYVRAARFVMMRMPCRAIQADYASASTPPPLGAAWRGGGRSPIVSISNVLLARLQASARA
jgi:hypothetical protein